MRKPQFYRQRFLLGFIQSFLRPLAKTDFMKYLFLASEKQNDNQYYFVPYLYGPFSFQVYADLARLAELKYITFTDKVEILLSDDYRKLLKTEDINTIDEIVKEFSCTHGDNLVRFVYEEFPFYAINSTIADKILDNPIKIDVPSTAQFFTIGYEGKTIDEYLYALVKQNIQSVIDVRKNPVSMKYGFSKSTLQNALKKIHINYLHLPKLGIESDKRQKLDTYADYEKLFSEYEKTVLPSAQQDLDLILNEYKKNNRLTLTCFEKDPLYCHRMRITNKLSEKNKNFQAVHL